jgi:uroporphyrinogen III methyltransferase/synthase
VLPVYRTVAPDISQYVSQSTALTDGGWITFTSSSTVENTVAAIGVDRLRNLKIASIGPVTSATVRRFGLEVSVEASPYTVDGLVDAMLGQTEPPPRGSGV